jgi:hypothetical protein
MKVQTFQIRIGSEIDMAGKMNSWFSENRGIDVKLAYTTEGETDPGGIGCSWLWVLYNEAEEVKWG